MGPIGPIGLHGPIRERILSDEEQQVIGGTVHLSRSLEPHWHNDCAHAATPCAARNLRMFLTA